MNIQRTLNKSLSKGSLVLTLTLLLSQTVIAQKINVNKLQGQLKTTVNKVLSASVFLIDYAPGPLVFIGARASGVVVKDGMILTAGHATTIGKKYRVVFPDGKECTATGLGKISALDAGMLKINEAGDWPFVEMGSSASLDLYQPCFSIAYPGGFQPQQPILRFGHVAELASKDVKGKLRTTCLMEPGDSGGPVFDLEGQVIGIRSSILLALENNFDVPVDAFRAYWTALQNGKIYRDEPVAEKEEIIAIAHSSSTVPSVKGFEQQLNPLESKLDEYCVKINSSIADEVVSVLGTVINIKSLAGKVKHSKGLLVSKSSMVGENPIVSMPNGAVEKAKVLARDDRNDLVLIELGKSLKMGVDIRAINPDSLSLINLGDFLISPSPDDEGELSLIGSKRFNLAITHTNPAFLGVGFEKIGDKVIIKNLVPFAPAELAKLEKNDEVISLNGIKITEPTQFSTLLRDKKPNDEITVVIARNGVETSKDIKLAKRPASEGRVHVADRFTDGRSVRRNGFTDIFVHDGKIKPSECGGPLFDLNEQFIGINIARYSRTSSIAIPALQLKKFIESNM